MVYVGKYLLSERMIKCMNACEYNISLQLAVLT